MSDYMSTTTHLPPIEEFGQRAPGHIPDEYDEQGDPNLDWSGQRWWYKLAQGRETTEEDEEGILLAIKHSDRIMTTMDEQFPILERLYILSRTGGDTSLVLPRTFQAPHLHHLFLWHAALPIGSPLLTTTVGLVVTLALRHIPPSAYFPPSYLLTRLSLMPQLEILEIGFQSPLPNCDVERQLLNTPIMTHITFPNLRWFSFKGVSAYLEGLLARINTPVLNWLNIEFFHQLTFTVPRLLAFTETSEIFSSNAVRLEFRAGTCFLRRDYQGQRMPSPFSLKVRCRHLDWQVSSAVQIFTALQPLLLAVEKLTLRHVEHDQSSEWHNEVDRTQWRQLLRQFSNLKTLHVQNELVGKLARSLQTVDGEPPLEILPNLKEVGCSGGDVARDAFIPFIDERRVAGRPVNLTMVDQSEFSRNCGHKPGNVGSAAASGQIDRDIWNIKYNFRHPFPPAFLDARVVWHFTLISMEQSSPPCVTHDVVEIVLQRQKARPGSHCQCQWVPFGGIAALIQGTCIVLRAQGTHPPVLRFPQQYQQFQLRGQPPPKCREREPPLSATLYYTGRIRDIHEDRVFSLLPSISLFRFSAPPPRRVHAWRRLTERDSLGWCEKSATTFCDWDAKSAATRQLNRKSHVNFRIEVECILRVLDGVVFVLCAVSGIH
ncbi:hypothetical protein BJV78DRAFT_1155870 [Lactifluus subvellereus]|nr:hypothetical protein BJV78DRAFT_1155870 [Lactifluus subvellereus]